MNKLSLLILVLILGLGTISLWRFFTTYKSENIHYHANFAVYINGERAALAEPTYYEELAGCDLHEFESPLARVHMHNGISELVHIHASAVTWGNFFENLGWSLGPDFLRTREQLLVADQKHPLIYLLNGQPITNPANMIIGDEDGLLISYGTADETVLQTQLASILTSAREQNLSPDPSSCGGASTDEWFERLRRKNIFD